jgi:hypothetical protein
MTTSPIRRIQDQLRYVMIAIMNFTRKVRLSSMIHWQNKTVKEDGIAQTVKKQNAEKPF